MQLYMSPQQLFKSPVFWSGLIGWFLAQFTKLLCDLSKKQAKLNLTCLVRSGGMPSAHTALTCALATSIGLTEGFSSSIFVLSLTVAILAMFDAATVRQATGQQARLINEIIDLLVTDGRFSNRKLVELLGHTRIEIFMGMVMGALVAIIVTSYFKLLE
jgi:acid phosphatase family membrane protein YuiD